MKPLEHELSNGLKIIGEPSTKARSVAVSYFVRTGSRDETEGESGVSHFLEHMMFKGTKKRSMLNITLDFANLGTQHNAYTSDEVTAYHLSVIPEHFRAAHEVLSDLFNSVLDKDEFELEKKVIIEEIALHEDQPQFTMFEQGIKEFFGKHPAGNIVLGTKESLIALTRDQMKSYFDRRYSAPNITLVAAGNFAWDDFIKDAETFTAGWNTKKIDRQQNSFSYTPVIKTFKKKNIQQAHLLLMAPSCSAQEEDRFAAAVISHILGDSSGSKLYWELVHTGIAEVAVIENDERDGVGCVLAYAATDVQRLDQVYDTLKARLACPLDISSEDIERAKRKLCSRVALSGELPMGRVQAMGNSWIYRRSVPQLCEILVNIQKVSKTDIEQYLHRYPWKEWSEFKLLPE